MAEALEVMIIPGSEQPKEEQEEQKSKIIKAKWQCAFCTLINTNGKTSCDACQMAAPDSAYEMVEQKVDNK